MIRDLNRYLTDKRGLVSWDQLEARGKCRAVGVFGRPFLDPLAQQWFLEEEQESEGNAQTI